MPAKFLAGELKVTRTLTVLHVLLLNSDEMTRTTAVTSSDFFTQFNAAANTDGTCGSAVSAGTVDNVTSVAFSFSLDQTYAGAMIAAIGSATEAAFGVTSDFFKSPKHRPIVSTGISVKHRTNS